MLDTEEIRWVKSTANELNNLLQQRQAKLMVIDKKDEQGAATGTTVIIKIKEELS